MCRSDKNGLLAEYGDFFGREKDIRKVNRQLESSHSFYCLYLAALASLLRRNF